MLYIQAEPDSVRWLYGIFSVLILLVLSLDLGLFNRKAHAISVREASIWTAVWIGLAMAFSGLIYLWTRDSHGLEKWTQFQTAYWIEKALSMDNLFVFMLIFNYFKVPDRLQHKVLFWGVIGALGMRALFIYAGVELVRLSFVHIPMPWLGNSAELEVNVLLFLFGGFLLFAGLNSLLSSSNDSQEFAGKGILDRISSVLPIGGDVSSGRFFLYQGKWLATPLFLVLLAVEFTDLLFAVDSVPAIFSVAPNDPFILYTSNIFAILGLRSLYFVLQGFSNLFSYLKKGLGFILIFIGCKMLVAPLFHIPSGLSLLVLAVILLLSILISVVKKKK
jgi:tellurite resistance protein TerC